MAATVEIHELNGGAETGTNKTGGSIRFKMADNATVDLADPINVPDSGTAYSMQKWLRMNVSGTYTQISSPRFYTDGGNGFGSGCKMWVKTAAAYATPAVPSTSDDPPHLSGVDMVTPSPTPPAARSLSTRSTPGRSPAPATRVTMRCWSTRSNPAPARASRPPRRSPSPGRRFDGARPAALRD